LIAAKGDAGAAGEAGAAGPPGAAGATGGSDVYATSKSEFGNGVAFTPEGVNFGSLSLPSGSYIAMATVLMTNGDGDDQNWTVELQYGNTALTTAGGNLKSDTRGTASLMVPFTANGDSATVLSWKGYGYGILVLGDDQNPISLVAMKVGTIHSQ
jgi:hypothetical protein